MLKSIKKPWFRAKWYGYGWFPSAWQGWLIILTFIGAVYGNFLRLDSMSHSASDTLRPFVIQSILMVLALILVCYLTGETPHWSWGKPKK